MVQSDSTLARWAEHRRAGFIPDSVVHPAAGPTPRVTAGVARNLAAVPELFADRALAATRSFRETEGEPLPVRRAKMLVRILRDHPIVIQDGEVIVGTKTRKPRGSPVFPEINCAWVERDLDRLSTPCEHAVLRRRRRPSRCCATWSSRTGRGGRLPTG